MFELFSLLGCVVLFAGFDLFEYLLYGRVACGACGFGCFAGWVGVLVPVGLSFRFAFGLLAVVSLSLFVFVLICLLLGGVLLLCFVALVFMLIVSCGFVVLMFELRLLFVLVFWVGFRLLLLFVLFGVYCALWFVVADLLLTLVVC